MLIWLLDFKSFFRPTSRHFSNRAVKRLRLLLTEKEKQVYVLRHMKEALKEKKTWIRSNIDFTSPAPIAVP